MPRFVIHKHKATHLHFDFRLEMEDTLKSWAVPKGVPEEAGIKRLAVALEDHQLDYIEVKVYKRPIRYSTLYLSNP